MCFVFTNDILYFKFCKKWFKICKWGTKKRKWTEVVYIWAFGHCCSAIDAFQHISQNYLYAIEKNCKKMNINDSKRKLHKQWLLWSIYLVPGMCLRQWTAPSEKPPWTTLTSRTAQRPCTHWINRHLGSHWHSNSSLISWSIYHFNPLPNCHQQRASEAKAALKCHF